MFAVERIFLRSHKCESRVSSAFLPRMQTCFERSDCLRASAVVRSQEPLQLLEAFARRHWMHLSGWTLTSVKWWQFRLRQHLREGGGNHGRGSPIKCLAGFTLNQYKKKFTIQTPRCAIFAPINHTKKKCFPCSDLVLGSIYKYNLYCAVKHRNLESLSRLWHFRGNFTLTWQHAYDF